MATFEVGYFVGSLAAASINRLLSKALVRLAPPELHLTEIPFRDLPLYSYDYDADFPAVATFRRKNQTPLASEIGGAAGGVFCTIVPGPAQGAVRGAKSLPKPF
jgi:NAD(P)H-dependent FMN reductase